MFFNNQLEINTLSLRLLAGLGDAVCSLIERERSLLFAHSAKQLHSRTKERVNAQAQAQDLDRLLQFLNEQELSLVHRATNLKSNNYRKVGQPTARKATAYEVLLGYLYLTDLSRLKELMTFLDKEDKSTEPE